MLPPFATFFVENLSGLRTPKANTDKSLHPPCPSCVFGGEICSETFSRESKKKEKDGVGNVQPGVLPPPLSPRQDRRRGSGYSHFPPPRSTTRWRPFTPPSSARPLLTLALPLLLARCPSYSRTLPASMTPQVSVSVLVLS